MPSVPVSKNKPADTWSAYALPVKLSRALFQKVDAAEDDSPKWVQIAAEGDYPGYRNGEQPFSLSRQTFEQIVANFRANPSYKAGEDGVGAADVIPWDFHHASELYPGDGDIPVIGAPAQAWTVELEIRDSAEGKAELWGLTRFLELARGYIKAGQYQWASVSVSFNTIDPASAKNVGAVLSSVALTNMPIVRGMQRLVASQQGARMVMGASYRNIWIEPADKPEDAVEMLKQLFGLPATGGLPELAGELGKLRAWSVPGAAPPGVDVDGLVGAMRMLFNLPSLSTVEEVLGEVDKAIAGLIQGQVGQPAVPDNGAGAAATAATAKEREKDMELIKTLAGKLGVREADAAVEAAVADLEALRAGAKKMLGSDSSTGRVLLEEIEKAVSARKKLTALLKALGVEDADGAVNKVAELMNQAKELASVMPELTNLKARVAKQEEQQAEAEVDAVIASRGWDVSLKDALLLSHKADPAKFREKYPTPKQGDEHLLSSVVLSRAGAGGQPNPAGPPAGQLPTTINLALYPGANITERAMSFIRASVPGSDKWTHEQVFTAACELKKQPNVVDAQ